MNNYELELKKELKDKLQENVPLRDHTSIGVGGIADFFFIAENINELVKAVSIARKINIPYFILGGGYNVVPSDSGFPGLVIKNQTSNIAFSNDNSQVIVDSGVGIGKLINTAASRDLGGLEFLFGVPGTIGGALYGNAGAFGYEIGEFVKSVIMLVVKEGEIKIVKRSAEWFEFSYRKSKLKNLDKDQKYPPVILTVKLQLVRRRRDEILGLIQQNIKKKRETQPLDEKSAGSFFKNVGKQVENSAGYMLDQVGAKKMKVGGAAVSKKHANFIINKKNASASEVRQLAESLKEKVKEKLGQELDEEVEYIGKW